MALFVVTIFLSAFLLFQVQPIIARYILPWYGGSPAVWTTCMLFFQIGLLAGYSYAHFLASKFRDQRRRQFWIHAGMILLSLVFMPITPPESLKPSGGSATSEVWDIVWLLARTVGLSYVVIAASGPLVQHWFAGTYPGKSPYRLYAVSNLGSLLGLLSYPFLFEPLLGLRHQTWWWSAGFVIYGIVVLVCAWNYSRRSTPSEPTPEGRPDPGLPISWTHRLLWVLFSACGSAGMLAITNQMSQDISVVPFLWVLPLALYLLTFIISFDRAKWYNRFFWIPLALLGTGLLIFLLNYSQDYSKDEIHIYLQIAIFLFALFTFCMVCHGEMVRLKPPSRNLTAFYLLISLGGALGGIFVSLIAPLLFNGYWELHFVILLAILLTGLVISLDAFRRYRFPIWGGLGLILTLQAVILSGIYLRKHYQSLKEDVITSLRGFHGVIRVLDNSPSSFYHHLAIYHGRITHGRQYFDESLRNQPTTYYTGRSGVGAVLQSLPQRLATPSQPISMGVVGLGAGSLAAHARTGDKIVFYEINPQVETLARTQFSYLADCPGEASVILGDARTSLEREVKEGQIGKYDVLFMDAFSGDSIPVHLLTEEAFAIYFKIIKEDGCLITHITNLHIDLSDPVRQLARKFGREALLVMHSPDAEDEYIAYFSEWIIITKNQAIIDRLYADEWVNPWSREFPSEIHWTDDYSNLLDVIVFDKKDFFRELKQAFGLNRKKSDASE